MTVHLLGGTLVFGINIICGQLFPFRWRLNLPKPTLHLNTNWCFGYGKVKLCQLGICGEKYNLNWKIFSLLSKNSNIYFDMQWWKLLWFLSKKKNCTFKWFFLDNTGHLLLSFTNFLLFFTKEKKKINFKVHKINFYKWEIHIKEENSSYNIM